MLRDDVNYEVIRNVDKKTIIQKAREHPELVRAWTLSKEGEEALPYDFNRDPKGVWKWDQASESFVLANPLALPRRHRPRSSNKLSLNHSAIQALR